MDAEEVFVFEAEHDEDVAVVGGTARAFWVGGDFASGSFQCGDDALNCDSERGVKGVGRYTFSASCSSDKVLPV